MILLLFLLANANGGKWCKIYYMPALFLTRNHLKSAPDVQFEKVAFDLSYA